MAIYTTMGNEVKIIGGNVGLGLATVERISDGRIFDTEIFRLKADYGIEEIEKAIRAKGGDKD